MADVPITNFGQPYVYQARRNGPAGSDKGGNLTSGGTGRTMPIANVGSQDAAGNIRTGGGTPGTPWGPGSGFDSKTSVVFPGSVGNQTINPQQVYNVTAGDSQIWNDPKALSTYLSSLPSYAAGTSIDILN